MLLDPPPFPRPASPPRSYTTPPFRFAPVPSFPSFARRSNRSPGGYICNYTAVREPSCAKRSLKSYLFFSLSLGERLAAHRREKLPGRLSRENESASPFSSLSFFSPRDSISGTAELARYEERKVASNPPNLLPPAVTLYICPRRRPVFEVTFNAERQTPTSPGDRL